MNGIPPRRATKTDSLEQEIEAALQPGHFIRHGAGWSFVDGLDRIEEKLAKLVRTAPALTAALYETFLAGCHEKAEELDDSSGNFGTFVDRLFSGWVKARQAAGSDPGETARRLVAWMDDDPYGFCYQLERDLVKVLDKRGLAAFERIIRQAVRRQSDRSPRTRRARARSGTCPATRGRDPALGSGRAARC